MAKTWFSGVLSAMFGQADTSHWLAVLNLMEQSFGKIIIDTPVEGGNIRAFFEKQVLIGDIDSIITGRSQDGGLTVDMDEPIGFGKNSYAAVIDLWQKLISLKPHENILLLVGKQQGLTFAEYISFRFKDGKFTGVTECTEFPPDRHAIIQKYFNDHRYRDFGVRKPA